MQDPVSSAQTDRYVHERVPPVAQWPTLLLPSDAGATRLNCVEFLLDRHVRGGWGDQPALLSDNASCSYSELFDRVGRIAQVLTREHGIEPGNRVLLRGFNSPMLVTLWLAIQKTGAIAVTSMPLLRRAELVEILTLSRPSVALSEPALAGELQDAIEAAGVQCALLGFGNDTADMDRSMRRHPPEFTPCDTADHDISLIGFTSGTTGRPKATIHFHRDVLAVCETVAGTLIQAQPDDRFIGTAPLAFTFGLGGLALFPLYAGASSVLNSRYSPESLLEAIGRHRATICFTVPTFYQRMAHSVERNDSASLRMSVSSGEALPLPVRQAWLSATGLNMTELLGSTEMLHAFIGSTGTDTRPGRIGVALAGYEVAIVDHQGTPLPPGTIGRLAVRGPTGCRYLDDERQGVYVQHGWNITGDACSMDTDGYVTWHTRMDDLIISSGYNISGIEIENALLEHPEVTECAVIGTPDPERGQVVTAFVVPRCRPRQVESLTATLQHHVKAHLAPYKYPRKIYYVDSLPRNESGKLQRFRLRAEPVDT